MRSYVRLIIAYSQRGWLYVITSIYKKIFWNGIREGTLNLRFAIYYVFVFFGLIHYSALSAAKAM